MLYRLNRAAVSDLLSSPRRNPHRDLIGETVGGCRRGGGGGTGAGTGCERSRGDRSVVLVAPAYTRISSERKRPVTVGISGRPRRRGILFPE
jgi:hypothetical protein